MASTNATTQKESNNFIEANVLIRRGVLGIIAVNVVNVAILYLSLAAIDFPAAFVGGTFGPLAIGPVVINSTVAAVGATLVYAMVARVVNRPNRVFTIVAGVVLLLSFAMFLAPDVADAPVRVFAVLGLMHISAAIVLVSILTHSPKSR